MMCLVLLTLNCAREHISCELPGLILDLLGSIELVDQPDLIGLASVDLTAREQDVFALRRPDEVHELFSCARCRRALAWRV